MSSANLKVEPVLMEDRETRNFRYRGVIIQVINEVDRTKVDYEHRRSNDQGHVERWWGYVSLNESNSLLRAEMPMKEVNEILHRVELPFRYMEHVRRCEERQFDEPYAENWRKPSVWWRAGCDYSHDLDSGESWDSVLRQWTRNVDALIDAGVVIETK